MATLERYLCVLGLVFTGCYFSPAAHAECGGQQQCIGVSIDPLVAPSHGTPLVSPPLDFGSQSAGTTSASKTILVAAVLGPAGTLATLNSITLGGTNAADFAITGGTCTVGTPSLLHDGQNQAQLGNACTLTVTFNPASVGAKAAAIDVQTTSITRTVPLTGSGTAFLPPAAGSATLTAQVNTPTPLDLAPFVTGPGVSGVSIAAAPAHGVATVSGTVVTYTPARDYFGPDSFSYTATGSGGSSAAAVVSVTVAGRPDPSQNPAVRGLLNSQAGTARRFARSQISNIQQRMESLHRGARSADAVIAGVSGSGAARTPAAGVGLAAAYRPPAGMTPGTSELPDMGPEGAAAGLVPTSFLATLVSAATTRSVNLSSGSDRADGSSGQADGASVWIGGNLHFGTREATSDASSLRFSTDGVSVGVDRRFSHSLAAGLGLGYARDRTDIGADGTHTRSRGSSLAAYASYQPTRNTYVDGLIGYGTLSHDMARYVAPVNEFATTQRAGKQLFGSLAGGYEIRGDALLLSPYGRLDAANHRLDEATETGAGSNALTYFEQTLQMRQVSLGLRVESRHATNFGWALPRLRIEARRDLESDREATIAYADQFTGPRYSLAPVAAKRDSVWWLGGIGSDFVFRDGLKLGIDYQVERTLGPDRSQAFRFWLSKDLDAKGLPTGWVSATPFDDPVRVEAGVTRDDNVNRSGTAADRLTDSIYSLNVGKGAMLPITSHTRWVANGFLSADKLRTHSGLDRVSGGYQVEIRHRTSGNFGAPTFAVFGRAALEDYHSDLRDGKRSSLGLSVRQSLTDRIDWFAALARNVRDARGSAFDALESAARFNLDYALGKNGTFYLGGEYRRGDAVSSGTASAESAAIAKVFVQDDAYGSRPLVAYRYAAKTVLWTLGCNLPLGPRDSIDLSARRAQTTPTSQPDPAAAGAYAAGGGSGAAETLRYTANQVSIAYLMRF